MNTADPYSLRILAARRPPAIDGITLDVARGEFLAILGPRAAGKSTLLRVLAGHEALDDGVLYLGGENVTHTPPHRRRLGYLPRAPVLFAHLPVAQNVAFGLKYTDLAPAAQEQRVAQMIELMELAGMELCLPSEVPFEATLRTAIARALAPAPRVLLIDDLLAEFDQPARFDIAARLKHLQQHSHLTILLATRDYREAVTLADRIAILQNGRIEQAGPARDVLERPRTTAAARVMGMTNFLRAQVIQSDGAIVTVRSQAGFETAILSHAGGCAPGDWVLFAIRPERLQLRHSEPEPGEALASMEVTLEHNTSDGEGTHWIVRNRSGERVSVRLPSLGDDWVVMGKAWVCWDPRHAAIVT